MTTRASTLARTARFVFALARTTTWSTGGTSGSTRASRCVQLSLPRPAPLPRPRTLLPSSGLGWEYESISRPHPSPFLGECTSFPTPRPRTDRVYSTHGYSLPAFTRKRLAGTELRKWLRGEADLAAVDLAALFAKCRLRKEKVQRPSGHNPPDDWG